jgi:hypothetical protein
MEWPGKQRDRTMKLETNPEQAAPFFAAQHECDPRCFKLSSDKIRMSGTRIEQQQVFNIIESHAKKPIPKNAAKYQKALVRSNLNNS